MIYHLFGLLPKHGVLAAIPALGTLAQYGWIGVNLFFALSGYLITQNLMRQPNDMRSVGQFWIRRAFRLLPAYAVLLASFAVARLCWPVASPLYEQVLNTAISTRSHTAFVQNMEMVSLGYFGNEWLRVTWSLAVEVQFYAIICLLFILIPRRWIAPALVVLVASSVTFRYWIFPEAPNARVALIVLLPSRLDAFALGGLLGLMPRGLERVGGVSRGLLGWLALAVTMTWLAVFSRGGFGAQTGALTPLYYSVISLGCVALIDLCAHSSTIAQRLARSRVLVRAGDLSYFLYLFHMPIAFTLFAVIAGIAPNLQTSAALLTMGLALVLLWGLAELSFRFMESPLIRYSRSLNNVRSSQAVF